jgi:hypothetical protein
MQSVSQAAWQVVIVAKVLLIGSGVVSAMPGHG